MTHASLFSGIGGPEVAAEMLGWENVFHCEINPFGRAVLEYYWPEAKSYDDIKKTDFREWRGKIDVLTGGFPCQPFSYAGRRGNRTGKDNHKFRQGHHNNGKAMKILTYNVRSWYRDTANGWANWRKRADRIRATIKDAAPDVLLLQESLPPMTARLLPDGYHAAGCSISHHVFVRDGFAEVERAGWHLRWCWALLRLPNAKRVAVVCVHTRWEESIREATAKAISTLRTGGAPIIAGGDWNNEPDTMRLPLFPLELRTTDLTTFQNRETKKEYELDYFAVSSNVAARPYWLGSWTDSDHLAVMLETENI